MVKIPSTLYYLESDDSEVRKFQGLFILREKTFDSLGKLDRLVPY